LNVEQGEEARERYPTIESIVDDYRNGLIMWGEVELRFPDKVDQDEILRLAEERNQSENQ